ncbi:MAG: oligosaccharide flippase family protein, partial [Solobacterium sp.]|nr:oligosaccharide flippase family protein [Solobacterium sp.]
SNSKIKKSIILSGLIGTGGLFVAKFLGLFYSIPLSRILGSDAYMNYYGTAYRIYSYILNVFTAGFPFAIATLVARYSVSDDNRALVMIKKISLIILSITGLAGMLLLIGFSGFLSALVAEGSDIPIMRTVLQILAVAIFFVPILSGLRGFYQGRKEMQEYAFSQAFEQLFRVGFLLSISYLIVYVFHQDRKYALYIAVLSTSISAIAGILQLLYFDHQKRNEFIYEEDSTVNKKALQEKLIKEFFQLSIPYLLVAIMGYSDDIFNSIFLPLGLKSYGAYTSEDINVILSAFNYVGTKLTAIPMILAPGFTSALIPHISSALADHDHEKVKQNVIDCINIILYIALPVSFCIFLYARSLYDILFYTNDLDTSVQVIQWIALEGFFGTLAPVITNLMMALELRKSILKRLVICTIIKGILILPFVRILGFKGAILSSMIGYLYLVLANIIEMNKSYQIDFKPIFMNFLKIGIGLIVMMIVSFGLNIIGLSVIDANRWIGLLKLMANGMITILIYFVVTVALKVPQDAFHIDIKKILRR